MGTRIGKWKKFKELIEQFKIEKEQIPILEKQINEIKNNYSYVTLNETKTLSNPQIISYNNQFENTITNKEKPKVLSIGQKKNEK